MSADVCVCVCGAFDVRERYRTGLNRMPSPLTSVNRLICETCTRCVSRVTVDDFVSQCPRINAGRER